MFLLTYYQSKALSHQGCQNKHANNHGNPWAIYGLGCHEVNNGNKNCWIDDLKRQVCQGFSNVITGQAMVR